MTSTREIAAASVGTVEGERLRLHPVESWNGRWYDQILLGSLRTEWPPNERNR